MAERGFGAHTFGFVWESAPEMAVEQIAAAGFTSLQLMATPPHYDPWRADSERDRQLRSVIERTGLPLLALDLASSDINLASAAPDVVDFAVKAYLRAIDHAAALGARWICVGSGRRHHLLAQANHQLMEYFRPAFARIQDAAMKAGIGVILENHPQGLLASAQGIERFLTQEGYWDVPVIYDVANGFAIDEDPVEGLKILHRRLGIVHLSDSPAGQWRHDEIGSGEIDFPGIGQYLADIAYRGPVVLEILSDHPLNGLIEGRKRLQSMGW